MANRPQKTLHEDEIENIGITSQCLDDALENGDENWPTHCVEECYPAVCLSYAGRTTRR